MNKILSLCSALLFAGTLAIAQPIPLPYVENFDNISAWKLFRKGATPINTWTTDNVGDGMSLGHSYPVNTSGDPATEDWFVSPEFEFASGGMIDSVRFRFTGFGTPATDDTVAIYLLQGNADPALATRTVLYDFRGTNYIQGNWTLATNITIPPTSGKCYIAFKYFTVNNWLDVRFDNLGLNSPTSSVQQVYKSGRDFTIFPNPAVNSITINTQVAFNWIDVYDATGKVVYSNTFQTNIDVQELPAGQYFIQLTDKHQQKVFHSITKQ